MKDEIEHRYIHLGFDRRIDLPETHRMTQIEYSMRFCLPQNIGFELHLL